MKIVGISVNPVKPEVSGFYRPGRPWSRGGQKMQRLMMEKFREST